jgi:endonuclease YncB( thermonuclease family)
MTICRAGSIAAVLVVASSIAGAGTLTGTATVIDGDTMKVGKVTVRINGIDAAELGQKCNLQAGGKWACDEAAADRLAELVQGESVECEALGNDPHGRIIATCFVGGIDVGRQLVEDGLAWAFIRYDDVYAKLEAVVSGAAIGIWQHPSEPPWDYRADRWERAAEAAPRADAPSKVISMARVSASITRRGRLGTREPRSTRAPESNGSVTRPKQSQRAGGRRGSGKASKSRLIGSTRRTDPRTSSPAGAAMPSGSAARPL